MTDDNRIKRPTWDSANRRWNLEGMAEAMYDWLRTRVPSETGASEFKGYQLAGTLDPDDPEPSRYQPPPPWLSPDVMMKAMCAWTAGSLQDYLFSQGVVPIVRAIVLRDDGSIHSMSGADVNIRSWLATDRYYVLIQQSTSPYPLTEYSTAICNPLCATPRSIALQKIPLDYVIPAPDLPEKEIDMSDYSGWRYSFGTGVTEEAVIHIFA